MKGKTLEPPSRSKAYSSVHPCSWFCPQPVLFPQCVISLGGGGVAAGPLELCPSNHAGNAPFTPREGPGPSVWAPRASVTIVHGVSHSLSACGNRGFWPQCFVKSGRVNVQTELLQTPTLYTAHSHSLAYRLAFVGEDEWAASQLLPAALPRLQLCEASQLAIGGLRQTLVTRNSRTWAISANATRIKQFLRRMLNMQVSFCPGEREQHRVQRSPRGGPVSSRARTRGLRPTDRAGPIGGGAGDAVGRAGRWARGRAGAGAAAAGAARAGGAAVPGEGRQRVGCFGCSLVRWGWSRPPPGYSTSTSLTLDPF